MNSCSRFTASFTNLGNSSVSPQETILAMVPKYTEISSRVNRSTTQQPYLDYFKMHKEFMVFLNSTIEKIDSPHAKESCMKIKETIVKLHDSIEKEYHRKNNFIQEISRRFGQ